ncbi:hypothetical protein E4T39_01226 [Aureobasidium subglaciale]|nr:hypothetical protein E4T39_01226 [Aureobasidium subglaciale]
MKQRITYLLHEAGGVDPATLDVSEHSIKLPELKAAKEWRVTLGTRELPKEHKYSNKVMKYTYAGLLSGTMIQ